MIFLDTNILINASGLLADEDMQHGQKIDSVTIINPFLAA